MVIRWTDEMRADTALPWKDFHQKYPDLTNGQYWGQRRTLGIEQAPLPQSMVLLLGDTHTGRSTRTFNPAVMAERIGRIGAKVLEYRNELSDPVEELIVVLVGDMVDGQNIFPAQATEQAVANAERQAHMFAQTFAAWALGQQPFFPRISLICVPGNHGASAPKQASERASWDVAAFRYLQIQLAPHGIDVRFNEEPEDPFFLLVKMRTHTAAVYHGHEVGSSIKAMEDRFFRWHANAGPFSLILTGHLHHLRAVKMDPFWHLQGGTLMSSDTHAFRRYGKNGPASCWLFTMDDDNPLVRLWPLRLD